MICSSLLLLLLPLGAMFAQRPKPVVDLSSEGIFQIVDTTDLRSRQINEPIHVVISSPNGAAFRFSLPLSDSGRAPLIGQGVVDLNAEVAREVRVTWVDTLNLVHVDATQNGRVIASAKAPYVVVRRAANGVAIESRSQLPPSVTPELQQPIEELKAAIESRLPSKMAEVYRGYEQDDKTNKYLRQLLDRADSVHVKSIQFQNSNVTRNVAQVNFRMIISFTANQGKIPTEAPSSWRAHLVRGGPKQP